MPDFHRPPEWQQHADRSSVLTDPVLTVRQLSRFQYAARKSPLRIDHALVFATAQGDYEAFLPPLRPTRTEVATKRYTAVYEVDMGIHPLHTELALPSDNDAFSFGVGVDLSWQVVDPARFVDSRHRDVPDLLLGEISRAGRAATRNFAIARSAEAEQALLHAIDVYGPLGATAGLQVNWTVRVRRDDENIEHMRRLQALTHAGAEEIHATRLGQTQDVAHDERARAQDMLQLGRAEAYGTRRHELVLEQQRREHELALLQGEQQLTMQSVEAQKIAFYQHHLESGGVSAWALHLSQHPDDSRLVMQSLHEDQLRLVQSQMDLVTQLLGDGQAERFELAGAKELALRAVNEILNQRLPGVANGPSPSPLPVEMGSGIHDHEPAPSMPSAAQVSEAPAGPAEPYMSPPAPPIPSYAPAAGWTPPPGYGVPPSRPPSHTPPPPAADEHTGADPTVDRDAPPPQAQP
ncbi:hypothetical protein ACFT9I_07640 [Streptomyces sp. NPDC057137]|uniref:hypothetical protein n=1 Tax=Streptomyces sp. NPDC057137 TaxID=3346030 RepID=UPI00362F0BC5